MTAAVRSDNRHPCIPCPSRVVKRMIISDEDESFADALLQTILKSGIETARVAPCQQTRRLRRFVGCLPHELLEFVQFSGDLADRRSAKLALRAGLAKVSTQKDHLQFLADEIESVLRPLLHTSLPEGRAGSRRSHGCQMTHLRVTLSNSASGTVSDLHHRRRTRFDARRNFSGGIGFKDNGRHCPYRRWFPCTMRLLSARRGVD
jgi:hypothetical protein